MVHFAKADLTRVFRKLEELTFRVRGLTEPRKDVHDDAKKLFNDFNTTVGVQAGFVVIDVSVNPRMPQQFKIKICLSFPESREVEGVISIGSSAKQSAHAYVLILKSYYRHEMGGNIGAALQKAQELLEAKDNRAVTRIKQYASLGYGSHNEGN